MKRLLALLLAMTMLLCLCACGKTDKAPEQPEESTTSATDNSTTSTEGDTTTTTAGESTTGTDTTTTTGESTTGTTTGGNKTTTGSKNTTTESQWGNWEPPIPPATTADSSDPENPDSDNPSQPDNRPQMKILSIGHSFSVDAMETYMWDLFEAAGYKVTIGYLYFPGCSLERHYHYIWNSEAKYQRYSKTSDGKWMPKNAQQVDYATNEVLKGGIRATDALWDEDWDIVTFQPSPDYGKGTMTYDCKWGCGKKVNDYDHFNKLVDAVQYFLESNGNTDVEFYYHMTWAFANDCRLWSFAYSNNDQMTMYQDFVAATKKYVVPNKKIKGIIPAGTAIQNARSSFMGDTFSMPGNYDPKADGYHLNDKGDLVAAMTWVAYFTGKKAMDFKISCRYSDAEYKAMAEAVDNAIAKWDSVTESSYKTKP